MSALLPPAALAAGAVGALSLGLAGRPSAAALRMTALGALAAALAFVWSAPAGAAWPPLLDLDAAARPALAVILLAAVPMALSLGPGGEARAALVLGSLFGMALLAASSSAAMMFVGLETMSLPAYLLVARSRAAAPRRLSAALRYFFAGGLAGGLFMLGAALWYSETGSWGASPAPAAGLAQGGLALMAAGALLKLGAFPLHWWLPDAYEAADPEVAGFLSTSMKAAAAVLLVRLCALAPDPAFARLLPAIGAATALAGAAMALRQESLARLLAYSSVSHAGLLILGAGAWALGGRSPEAWSALLLYLAAYAFMSNGAFAFLRASGLATRACLRGYAASRPAGAAVFTALLFSLAGMPPSGGFLAKLLVLWRALEAGAPRPALAAALAALVSLGYYLGLVRDMWFEEPSACAERGPEGGAGAWAAAAVCAAGAWLLGLWPWLAGRAGWAL